MNPAASNGIEFYERENHVRYQEDAAGNLEKISLSPTPRDRGWIIGTTRCGHALRFQLVSEYTCMQIDLIFETRSFDNKNVSVGHLLIIKIMYDGEAHCSVLLGFGFADHKMR